MTIRDEADIAVRLAALVDVDPRLAEIARTAGPLPLRLLEPGLSGLVGIVVGQQVSRASATAILTRLTGELDTNDAAALRNAGDETFRRAGLSRPKQRTMRALGAAVMEGRLDFDRIADLPAAPALAELAAVSGIGPWTAECYLLFCAGHPDVFPSGDLALQVAIGHAFDEPARPNAKAVATLAEAWSPHRAVAARLFWAYYAAITRRDAVPVG